MRFLYTTGTRYTKPSAKAFAIPPNLTGRNAVIRLRVKFAAAAVVAMMIAPIFAAVGPLEDGGPADE